MLIQSAMDIQVNQGRHVLFYLAKYMYKEDTEVTLEHNTETAWDHMRSRVIGAVEASYFQCGWSKHRNSRGVIFVNICLSGHDYRRLLKVDIGRLPPTSTNLFYNSHVDKCLGRHTQLKCLTMPEYFTYYVLAREMNNVEEFNNEGPQGMLSDYDYYGYNRSELIEHDERISKDIPIKCADNFKRRYKKRSSFRKLPFWRAHLYNQTQ